MLALKFNQTPCGPWQLPFFRASNAIPIDAQSEGCHALCGEGAAFNRGNGCIQSFRKPKK